MQQLQAVQHVFRAQLVDHFYQLACRQPEQAAITAILAPVAVHLCRQLDAQADQGRCFKQFAALDDKAQLRQGLDNEEAGNSELTRTQAEIDELFVFIAIADDVTVVVRQARQRNHQFRLAARLEAVVVAGAETGNLLHHRRLLVDLDGEDAAVVIAVAGFTDGAGKRFIKQADPVVEQVLDAQQHRHIEAATAHTMHNIHQRHTRTVEARRYDLHFSLGYAVQLRSLGNTPAVVLCVHDSLHCAPL